MFLFPWAKAELTRGSAAPMEETGSALPPLGDALFSALIITMIIICGRNCREAVRSHLKSKAHTLRILIFVLSQGEGAGGWGERVRGWGRRR